MKFSNLLFFLAIFFLVQIIPIHSTLAQNSPEIIITWHAATFTPPEYAGKPLLIYGANVTVAVAIISGNNLASLTNQQIDWYINNSIVDGGIGKTEITFPAQISPGSSLDLRVEIKNYQGGATLVKNIFLPAVSPKAVIQPLDKNSRGENSFLALPYFFIATSTADLVAIWSVDSQTANTSQLADQFMFPVMFGQFLPGDRTLIKVAIANIDPLYQESASKSLTFIH